MKITSDWLQNYNRTWLRKDIISGVILAAFLLPSALADASLANLPAQAGLYACIFSGLIFWLFCSSRHTAITVTSGISLLVGASLGDLAGGDPQRFAALAACTAILMGLLALIAWLVKAGVVVSFISETVLTGFKFGIALVLISTQLPKLFGFPGTHGDFWERTYYFISHLHLTNPAALLVGASAIGALIIGKIYLKSAPISLVVLLAGIAASSLFGLSQYGIKMLGHIPQVVPLPALPAVQLSDINELLPLAMACFLLGSVETVAIGRMFALKHRYHFDPDREFLGLAGSNILSGLFAGFPVSGGMSQSLVNESSGARTPLSGLVAAGVMLLVTLFLSDMLKDLPQPVLAALVLMAVTGLIKIKALKQLWRFSREEFLVAIVALIGVLGSGILRGVLIGAVLSLALLIRRASRPRTSELGRVAGTDYFSDRIRHPENHREPDLFVFRPEGALLYFNVEFVRENFDDLLSELPEPPRLVIFYFGMVPLIDLAGIDMLAELYKSLKSQGIELRLAEAHGQIREALRRGGFEDLYGPIDANQTVATVIKHWQNQSKA